MIKVYPARLVKRIVALIVDLGLLYLVGYLLTLVLGDLFLYLGSFKIVIGIVISTAYFTYSHSEMGKGQTIGKKIFDFKVLKMDGSYLSINESLIRALIFTLPYCLSDLQSLNLTKSINVWQFISYTIIPASLFINHFFIFTNKYRQCYSDVLLNSVVSGREENKGFSLSNPKTWLRYIPGIVLVGVVVSGILILEPLSEQNIEDVAELSEIKSVLGENRRVVFSKSYFSYKNNDQFNKELKIECFIHEDQDVSSEIYLITEEIAPLKSKFGIRKVVLSIVRDFNLGIYSSWEVLKKDEKLMKFDL